MRQQGMCEEDIKFRTALENLRYKACTQEDITLLKSRVAGPLPHQPKLSDPIYRGVPIITARNVHRDKINEMGAARFALDTGQELICFNSKDKWARRKDLESLRATQRAHEKTLDLIRSHNIVDPAIQKMLWDLPPCCTDNHAGSLSLCIGMPVMLKYNEATELCATNGAEATVVGWLEALSEDGHRYLDTLFIRLQNPPRVQHLPGLPENVIPIVPSSKTITCDTQAAKKPRIERKQVPILLNFAMTDFCSQGRTRPVNPVDLHNCGGFQSAYTCLSRGTSLKSTIIIQPFEESLLRGGAPGNIRREFRDLEILDHIGYLYHSGRLHKDIRGATRHALIKAYQNIYGKRSVPSQVHSALHWSSWSDKDLQPPNHWNKYSEPWFIWHRSSEEHAKVKEKFYGHQKPQNSVEQVIKRGSPDTNITDKMEKKRKFIDMMNPVDSHIFRPVGFVWDPVDWSCAYDSTLLILYNLYREIGASAFKELLPSTAPVRYLQRKMHFCINQQSQESMEIMRNDIRDYLSAMNNMEFPRHGQVPASAAAVAATFVQPKSKNALFTRSCCGNRRDKRIGTAVWYADNDLLHQSQRPPSAEIMQESISSSRWIELISHRYRPSHICSTCNKPMLETINFTDPPRMMILSLPPDNTASRTTVDKVLSMTCGLTNITWKLRGIVYFGNLHFTSRYIDSGGRIWYQDGMATRVCLQEPASTPLEEAHGAAASLLVYMHC
ncbi:hypothetical protein PUNSTDRAFT_78293 [Punctularia strigosozonata HHB-11173 SS5]|uniref:Uncharacterized protein n=1 Tax=Punctularia strigosozonata (strain HHB-11173) TaxID=741275 RepID=R7S0J6_PUNST|nr:uncharacterized protein PUNSTDRAFT_78293 [Punctularia strigosozonata HHB-11173 SS5]EIN03374.1 hypothetical protein PUNSTDRAFT_78293 [Punctularia strigosozonata HHB-11173 SS5]